MIVTIQEVQAELKTPAPEEKIKRKIKATEVLVRNTTNNNFQDGRMRMYVAVKNGMLQSTFPYLKDGDNIEIGESINEGLYTIEEMVDGKMTIREPLIDCEHNMITKINYPLDVQEGVINLLKWDFENRGKVGIKSEAISRHSVTYYDMDVNNTKNGYPVSLMAFLKPYTKPRY